MSRILTHDHAIAQKENPHARQHHYRSRSEDEKKLTIAVDLPAETPLLPCTPLTPRKIGLKFPKPGKRRLKINTSHDRPVKSRRRSANHDQMNFADGQMVQSPGRVRGNGEARSYSSSSPDICETALKQRHVSDDGPFRQALPDPHSRHEPCYEEAALDIESVREDTKAAAILVEVSKNTKDTQDHTAEGPVANIGAAAAPSRYLLVEQQWSSEETE